MAKLKRQQPTLEFLQQALNIMDGGVLMLGSHNPGDEQFCALEFANALKGQAFSDDDDVMPNLRDMNDSPVWKSNKDRTDHLLPAIVALWNWEYWTHQQRVNWSDFVQEGIAKIYKKYKDFNPDAPDNEYDAASDPESDEILQPRSRDRKEVLAHLNLAISAAKQVEKRKGR